MNLRVHVRLSCCDTKVPDGQLSTHFPSDKKNPGKQPVHCTWSMVEATLKLGILHEVHLAPQPIKSLLTTPIGRWRQC